MTVFSFDRDGTLKMERWSVTRGTSQPGPIRKEHLERIREDGHILGGASASTPQRQEEEWDLWGVPGDFFIRKDQIQTLKERFPDHHRYVHVDDQTWKRKVRKICEASGFELIGPLEFIRRFFTDK